MEIAVESGSRFSSCLITALVPYSCGVTEIDCLVNVSLVPLSLQICDIMKNRMVVVVSHSHSDFIALMKSGYFRTKECSSR